jgi:hypothetical protein
VSKLTLEIVPGHVLPPWLAGTDAILLYWISVSNDGGEPITGLASNFSVETLAISWPTHGLRIVFNGGQAVERSPGFYLVGLLPETPAPDTKWVPATYVLGITVRRRRRWIGTDTGQTFLSFTIPWPGT